MGYYEKGDLFLPESSSWRLFKFELGDGRVINLKNQVYDLSQLRMYLTKFNPVSVWYSSSCWLNPLNLKAKERSDSHYEIADALFLSQDTVFDFDSEEDLSKARDDALKVIKHLGTNNLKYILFTGGKGFQLVYKPSLVPKFTPKEREEQYEQYHKALIEKVLTKVFKVPKNKIYKTKKQFNQLTKYTSLDPAITIDTRRVIRLPNTIHKSGRMATILSIDELKQPIHTLLSRVRTLISERPRKVNEKNHPAKGPVGDRPEIRTPTTFKFITNRVTGTKNHYIPIIKKHKNNFNKHIYETLNKYNINITYTFKTKEHYWILSPITITKERLIKILKATKSENLQELTKYSHNHFRTSNTTNGEPEPKFIDMTFARSNKEHYYSKPHMHYFNQIGIPGIYDNLIGKKQQKIYQATTQ